MNLHSIADIVSLSIETKLKMVIGSFPRGPLIVYLAPTQKCNFKCKLCEISKPETTNLPEEMSTERIMSLLDELKESKTKIIGIWGGEPLIHRDIGLIIKKAHSLDMYTYLTTNGYLLTPEKIRLLLESGIHSVSISIDHTEPERHDELRGIKGAFAKAIEGTKVLVAEGKGKVNIGINMVIHKANFSEIVPMASLAKKLGVHWFKVIPVHAEYPFSHNDFERAGIQCTHDECRQLEESLEEAARILSRAGLYTNSPFYRKGVVNYFKGNRTHYSCKAGFLLANINSYGDVSLCTRDTRVIGNLRTTTFKNIWFSDRFQYIRKETQRSICTHCWLSCFVEPSLRLSLSFHLRNIGTSLQEVSFAGKR